MGRKAKAASTLPMPVGAAGVVQVTPSPQADRNRKLVAKSKCKESNLKVFGFCICE
jgi:hypothetical protein